MEGTMRLVFILAVSSAILQQAAALTRNNPATKITKTTPKANTTATTIINTTIPTSTSVYPSTKRTSTADVVKLFNGGLLTMNHSHTTLPTPITADTKTTQGLTSRTDTNSTSTVTPVGPNKVEETNNNTPGNSTQSLIENNFGNVWTGITVEEVNLLLEDSATIAFLSSLKSDLKRTVVREQLRLCPYTPLCRFSFNLTIQDKSFIPCCGSCNCDSQCMARGDCCPDVIPKRFYKGRTTSSKPSLTCQPEELGKLQTREYAYMKNDCPDDTDEYLRARCLQEYDVTSVSEFHDIVPVKDLTTGLIYRNSYCARCQNISEFQVAETKLFCLEDFVVDVAEKYKSERELLYDVLNGTIPCYLVFVGLRFHRCQRTITSCGTNRNDRTFKKVCQVYQSIVSTDGRYDLPYNNVFCRKCNEHERMIEYICHFFEAHESRMYSYPFSALLTLYPGEKITAHEEMFYENGSRYDCLTGRYREIYCSPMRELRNQSCQTRRDINFLNYATYTITYKLTPYRYMSLIMAYQPTHAFVLYESMSVYIDNILQGVSSYFICLEQILLVSKTQYSDAFPLELLHGQSLSHILVKIRLFPDSIVFNPEFVLELLVNHSLDGFKPSVFDHGLFTFEPPTLYDDCGKIFETTINMSIALTDALLNQTEFLDHTFLKIDSYVKDVITNNIVVPLPDYFMCQSTGPSYKLFEFMPCEMFEISKDELDWHYTTYGVIFPSINLQLNFTDFVHSDDDVNILRVCVDTYFTGRSEEVNDKNISSLEMTSIVCSGLSILAILVTLLVYALFPSLRTLPGKNIMSLCLNLMLGQSLYLMGSFSRFAAKSLECQLVGLLTHFFWLSSFFWMNVCTYHMHHILSKTRAMVVVGETKRLLCYHTFSLLSSGTFVLLNVLISLFYFENETFGYGERICYISSSTMVIFTFAVPLGMVLFSNLLMFVRVIISIRRTSEIQRNTSVERNNIKVFAKLSTITGLTWIVGFVHSWINVDVLSYIFIILNGSQGVLIFLSFVCNRRVLLLLKQLGRTESSAERHVVRPTKVSTISNTRL